ncbi:putative peptidase M24, creatinase/aminopeptidase, FACT complex subunit Spt16 [Helianthus annuus]|nr:putative peptidase M24, creatinase/aminopeptidase, FACT complex subunit Spt16 [Helianthus annuus]
MRSNPRHKLVFPAAISINKHNNRQFGRRTFLIDSNTTLSKAYQVLLKAHEAAVAVGAMKPGNKGSDVYKAALSVIQKETPVTFSTLR